ncbi:hypothetical protein [Legionella gresilensis]|nr:hypothetical protein [Legionella gresilensis]
MPNKPLSNPTEFLSAYQAYFDIHDNTTGSFFTEAMTDATTSIDRKAYF